MVGQGVVQGTGQAGQGIAQGSASVARGAGQATVGVARGAGTVRPRLAEVHCWVTAARPCNEVAFGQNAQPSSWHSGTAQYAKNTGDLELRPKILEANKSSSQDPSGLRGYIVLLDGRTMLRSKYAMLSNQQRKPSFKFGTGDEFGSVILLLSNKGIQLVGSQCLTQG
jgi:hypothetical protein